MKVVDFVASCATCEKEGPTIRQHQGAAVYLCPAVVDADWQPKGQAVWDDFLTEHEHHDIRVQTKA